MKTLLADVENKVDLLPHNLETYNELLESLKTSNRVAVVQATGTGKSYVAARYLSDIRFNNILFIAPSYYIVNNFLGQFPYLKPYINFILYQKLTYMTDEDIKELKPQCIVIDEFHHAGAEKWGRAIGVLIDNNPEITILGTTATPIRYLDGLRNIADEIFNGNTVGNISLTDAIVRKIIPVPKYVSALYSIQEEKTSILNKIKRSFKTELEKQEIIDKLNAAALKWEQSQGVHKILSNHITKENKILVFGRDIDHLDELEVLLIKWFKESNINKPVKVYKVHSGRNDSFDELEKYKSAKDKEVVHLLLSVGMLNEGVHLGKNVDAVIMLRPTVSYGLFLQQIGRAIEVEKTSQPLIIDLVNNFKSVQTSRFNSDLEESIKSEVERLKDKKDITNIKYSGFTIFDEVSDIRSILEEISYALGDWQERYSLARDYYENNRTWVIQSTPENKSLGEWCADQRVQYKYNNLSNERVTLLNKLNFNWEAHTSKWESKYLELRSFYLENRNKSIPQTSNFIKLFRWVGTQRYNYKMGLLSEDRIELLNQIGISWDLDSILHKNWLKKYNELKEFILVNNTFPKISDNLSSWVNNQKTSYRVNKLSSTQIELLNELGIIWSDKDNKWNIYYNKIKEYFDKDGAWPITGYRGDKDKTNIRNFITKQCKMLESGELESKKVELLNKINFDFKL